MSSTSSAEEKPKRATRKRAVAVESNLPVRASRASRKTITKKVVESPVAPVATKRAEPAEGVERKAPTPLASEQVIRKQKRTQYAIVAVVLLIGVGASAAVGFTDEGQIDVNKTIEARNERIRTNTADARDTLVSTVEVPVQDTNGQGASSALVGRGVGSATKPAEATTTEMMADESASSTEAAASSTDEVIVSEEGTESGSVEETNDVSIEDEEVTSESVAEPAL